MRHLLALLLMGMMPLHAQFTQPQQKATLGFGEKGHTFTFEADNAIEEAEPKCECTHVQIAGKRLIAEVDSSDFIPGQWTSKEIEVEMEDGRECQLRVDIFIPAALVASAKSLVWKSGEQGSKTLQLRIPKGSPVRALTRASLVGDDFSFETKTLRVGREYEVRVTPKSTGGKKLNRLLLDCESVDVRYRRTQVYLQQR